MSEEAFRRRVFRRRAVVLAALAMLDQLAYFQTIAGVGANPPPPSGFWDAAFAAGLSTLALWIGCGAFVAKSKGRTPWWGLAGLVACCGIALLLILPSKPMDDSSGEYEAGDYPRPKQK